MNQNLNKSVVDILMDDRYYIRDVDDKCNASNYRIMIPLKDLSSDQVELISSLDSIPRVGLRTSVVYDEKDPHEGHLVLKSNTFFLNNKNHDGIAESMRTILNQTFGDYKLKMEDKQKIEDRKNHLSERSKSIQDQAVEIRNHLGPLEKVRNYVDWILPAISSKNSKDGLIVGPVFTALAMRASHMFMRPVHSFIFSHLSLGSLIIGSAIIGASIGFLSQAAQNINYYRQAGDVKSKIDQMEQKDNVSMLMESVINQFNPHGARHEFDQVLKNSHFNIEEIESVSNIFGEPLKCLIKNQGDQPANFDDTSAGLLKIKSKIQNKAPGPEISVQPQIMKF